MLKMMIFIAGLIGLVFGFFASVSNAQTPVGLLESRNGRFNVISTGGTLRAASNDVNPCSRITTSNGALSGLPAGATVVRAYLYWAGSGQTPDNTITFDGVSYTADRTFNELYTLGSSSFYFFGAVKDVTARIQSRRNRTYSFTNLNFQTGNPTGQPYCNQQGVMGGWALYVVYQDAAETPKRVNLYEGFELFRNSSRTLALTGLTLPPAPTGRMSVLAWEGDPSLSGGGENFTVNGNGLVDALNPLGNVYNSTINGLNSSTTYGVDLDTFDISTFLTPGGTSVSAGVTSGDDLVLLNAVAISASTLVADLELSKTANVTTAGEGQQITYTLSVFNRGPNASSSSQIRDLLPSGLAYVSSATSSGSYNPATGIWTTGSIAANTTATLTITAAVNSGTAGTTIQNSAEVILADNFDPDSTENNGATTEDDYAAVSVNIRPNANLAITKTGPATASINQTISYTIQVTNSGPANASGITISDVVPAGITVTNWTCAPTGTASCGTASGTTSNINLTGSVNSGTGNRLTITVNGTVNSAGSITNTATVAVPATLNDPVQANNTSSVTTLVGISVGGTVWRDVNGSANNTFSNIQSSGETGTNAGGLFVVAVDSAGNVIGFASVAANGTYTITGVPPNSSGVSLRLSTTSGTVGQPAPTAAIPVGWANTSPLATAAFNTATANLTGRDFGIEQTPTAIGTAAPSQPNPSGTNSVTAPSTIFAGADPDGIVASFTLLSFPTNTTSITVGGTNYTAGTFPPSGIVVTATTGVFPADFVDVDPIDGAVTVAISFIVTDNAGKPSAASATATIPFTNSLPPNVTLAKSCSAPANCESENQLPGADLTYTIVFANSGGQSAQGLTIVDAIPANTDFKIGTAAVVAPSGMTFAIEYSFDYNPADPPAATWTNAPPVSGGGGASAGYNALVKAIRWRNTAGLLSNSSPNNSGSVNFTVKIR